MSSSEVSADPLLQFEAWDVFDWHNEELLRRFEALRTALSQLEEKRDDDVASSSAAPRLQQLQSVVEREMKERGVGYELFQRILGTPAGTTPAASSSSPPPSLSDPNPSVEQHSTTALRTTGGTEEEDSEDEDEEEKGAGAASKRRQSVALAMTIRPPWFTNNTPPTATETTDCSSKGDAITPTSKTEIHAFRKGLWDHSSDEDDDDDDGAAPPPLLVDGRVQRKRGPRRQYAVMNRLGYFVVPSKKRKSKKKVTEPQTIVERKPAVPKASDLPASRAGGEATGVHNRVPPPPPKRVSSAGTERVPPKRSLSHSSDLNPSSVLKGSSSSSSTLLKRLPPLQSKTSDAKTTSSCSATSATARVPLPAHSSRRVPLTQRKETGPSSSCTSIPLDGRRSAPPVLQASLPAVAEGQSVSDEPQSGTVPVPTDTEQEHSDSKTDTAVQQVEGKEQATATNNLASSENRNSSLLFPDETKYKEEGGGNSGLECRSRHMFVVRSLNSLLPSTVATASPSSPHAKLLQDDGDNDVCEGWGSQQDDESSSARVAMKVVAASAAGSTPGAIKGGSKPHTDREVLDVPPAAKLSVITAQAGTSDDWNGDADKGASSSSSPTPEESSERTPLVPSTTVRDPLAQQRQHEVFAKEGLMAVEEGEVRNSKKIQSQLPHSSSEMRGATNTSVVTGLAQIGNDRRVAPLTSKPNVFPVSEEPQYASLCAMLVDPTYLFSFDTQPAAVQRQALELLRSALRHWLGVSSTTPSLSSAATAATQKAASAQHTTTKPMTGNKRGSTSSITADASTPPLPGGGSKGAHRLPSLSDPPRPTAGSLKKDIFPSPSPFSTSKPSSIMVSCKPSDDPSDDEDVEDDEGRPEQTETRHLLEFQRRKDRYLWYLVETSHDEVYDLVTSVLDDLVAGGEDDDNDENHTDGTRLAWVESPVMLPSIDDREILADPMRTSSSRRSWLWNLWWTWGKPRVREACVWIRGAQWVNHIPQSRALTNKDRLAGAVQRLCRHRRGNVHQPQQWPSTLLCRNNNNNSDEHRVVGSMASLRSDPFFVCAPTFVLPQEYVSFAKLFAEVRGLWILKPVGMSRARGITLVTEIEDVQYESTVVLQKYIERPLLVDRAYKFDLRLYVLVTSFQPTLEAFISTLGFARIAGRRYTPVGGGVGPNTTVGGGGAAQRRDFGGNREGHLTNTSVSLAAKATSSSTAAGGGSLRPDTKWTLATLRQRFHERVGTTNATSGSNSTTVPWEVVWSRIRTVVTTTLVAVQGSIPAAPCTFELFGFDVMLDDEYRPWVIEVNASPSMEITGAEDEEVKPTLIHDVVKLVDPAPLDRLALLEAVEAALEGGGTGNTTAAPSSSGPTAAGARKKSTNSTGVGKQTTTAPWAQVRDRILRGWVPRAVGEIPKHLGQFEVLAPSEEYRQLKKQRRQV